MWLANEWYGRGDDGALVKKCSNGLASWLIILFDCLFLTNVVSFIANNVEIDLDLINILSHFPLTYHLSTHIVDIKYQNP